jgi:glycosyltransferase involved in cell wall biosynthesis
LEPTTLYLTRNGLLEPLGQSQVLAYLRGLSRDYRITLITYEKDEDRADEVRMAQAREECERLGIRWLPQRFRPRPKVIAPAFSMMRMAWLLWREVKGQDAELIHARSYIPAAVAMIASRVTGVPFIFDMRALWPEELITAGRLRRGSLIHRAIVAAERTCLQRASAVVSLTRAALVYLETAYPKEMARQRAVVIPTCADLDRFAPAKCPPERRVIGCLGTVLSGWFKLDWLATFLSVAMKRDPELNFEITTQDDPDRVRASVDPAGESGERHRIASSKPGDVQKVLWGQMASVMFFTVGLSKLGSSPTRMAEILGCGLPVVANSGVGDVADIIHRYNVGVIVEEGTEAAMAAALEALDELWSDPDLSRRCRQAAEEVFSLEAGTEAYRRLYAEILDEADATKASANQSTANAR